MLFSCVKKRTAAAQKSAAKAAACKFGSFLGRAVIAPLFIVGAQNALKNSQGLGALTESAAQKIGLGSLPVSGETFVKINGYSQIGLGSTLALGIFPKCSAAGLAASLAATTYVGHAYWDMESEQEKNQHRLQFFKNLAVLGGLVYIATNRSKR